MPASAAISLDISVFADSVLSASLFQHRVFSIVSLLYVKCWNLPFYVYAE